MRLSRPASRREPTIALINIVFLMLVFFMVAGTLAQPVDGKVSLVKTGDLDPTAPPDALVIHADGRMSYRGDPISDASSYVALRTQEGEEPEALRIIPDRDLPARGLVAIARELRDAGAERVVITTERGLE